MGSRKESIKKSLGISEYPWSSDDEEDTGAFPPPAVPEPAPAVRQSHFDAPGTSGVSSSSSSTAPFIKGIIEMRSKTASAQERDTFWSLLNNPRRVPSLNLPKNSSTRVDVPLSLISRPSTSRSVSQPERTSQSNPTGHSTVHQRMMAIRRINRNAARPSKSLQTPRASRDREPRVSVYSGPQHRDTRDENSRAVEREVNAYISAKRSSKPRDRTDRDQPPTSPHLNEQSFEETEEPSGSGILQPIVSTVEPSFGEPVNVDQSDDEDTENDVSAMPSPGTAMRAEDVTLQIEENNTTEPDGAANISTVALEEEIVEIDVEPDAGAVPSVSPNDDGPHRDPHEDPTEALNNSFIIENRGTKRKHEATGEHEPASVKEFNSSLLRLLECPVCLEWMEPPMSQCRRGHLVCGRCRARLAACPVCRTAFSSVRNRAMEGVADMLRYPCRHGCGREVRLRQRAPHEASCSSRRYRCVVPACADRPPLPHNELAQHFQSKHLPVLKIGRKHKFTLKVNTELHENWVIMTLRELFHLRIDVDVRTWGVVVYAAYIGPKCYANSYSYEVTVLGKYHSRKLVYTRATHCDLECSSLNVSRQDCFHLTLDQALNFLRVKNRHCEPDDCLHFTVEINKSENPERDDSDS